VQTIIQDAAAADPARAAARLPPLMPPALAAAARRAWVHEAWSCVRVSAFQRELAAALAAMGLAPRLEHATADGLFLVDVAVLAPGGRRFAFEADGPLHFSRNAPHGPLGHSIARCGWRPGCRLRGAWCSPAARRLPPALDRCLSQLPDACGRAAAAGTLLPWRRWHCLRARGWCVVSVRLHTWAALQGDEARRAHLAAAMEAAAAGGSGIVLSDQRVAGPGGGARGKGARGKGARDWEVVRMLNWKNWVI
jgi:hypothetical protein